MKILQISNLGYTHGGVETGLVLLKAELKRRGHDVKIFTSNSRPDLPHFSDVEFDALEHKPRILQLLYRSFFPDPYFALKKFLKEYQPDVVHLHTLSQMSPSILFLLKDYRTLATVHQSEDYTISILPWSFPVSYFKDDSYRLEKLTFIGRLHYAYHKYISHPAYLFGFKYVDKFIAVSNYMKECLRKDGVDSIVIPNATKLFTHYPIDAKSRTLLYVGRLEHTKGIGTILDALPSIIEKFPDVQLNIAGRGSFKDKLEGHVEQLGIKKYVNFLGYQNRNQLNELLKQSAIVIMPSVWPESFGLVGIEAMSVGRPVIATNTGGASDWLTDGSNGFLIPINSPKSILEKVSTMFTNPDLLKRFSENAQAASLEFSIEQYATRLLNVIQQIPN